MNERERRIILTDDELAALNESLGAGMHVQADAAASVSAMEFPSIFTERKLSDEQILAIGTTDLNVVRASIATPADFTAWLETIDTRYCSNIVCDDRGSRNFDPFFCFEWSSDMIGAPMTASLAQYILADDFEGLQIIVANMDYSDGVLLSGNLFPYEGKQYLLSLDTSLKARQNASCMMEIFLPQQINSLEDIVAYCGSSRDISAPGGKLLQAFSISDGTDVVFSCEGGILSSDSPAVSEFYHDPDAAAILYERDFGHIVPENIGAYQISQMLGGVTLSAEEARALVNASPETVRVAVHTAGDVLMYMLAAQITDCGGDRTMQVDGNVWHYNLNAREVMEQHQANCGASANLARYLLDGDYDEVGFILHAYYAGNGGGHVYNYIIHEGKTYIVDFGWYIFANYRPENDFPVMELSDVKEYGGCVQDLYGGVSMVLAHTSTGQHYPNIFGEDTDASDRHYYIPAGTEYTLLYQASDAGSYQLAEMPLSTEALNWNLFW